LLFFFVLLLSYTLCLIEWETYVLSPSRALDAHRYVQGAKAQQKRERNAKDANKGGKSQLKANEASKTIVCQTCRQPFVSRICSLC
jgi:hypothetical protein